jgi:acyl dehydratase
MRLKDALPANQAVTIGSYEFTPEGIVEFATKFDPQFFHVDAEKAKDSVFGGLCASGWHICSAAMKVNVAYIMKMVGDLKAKGIEPPKLGPSPGIRGIKWLKPVFAGDTVTYSMRYLDERPVPHRPGRHIAEVEYEGRNQNGDLVVSFQSGVVEFD